MLVSNLVMSFMHNSYGTNILSVHFLFYYNLYFRLKTVTMMFFITSEDVLPKREEVRLYLLCNLTITE